MNIDAAKRAAITNIVGPTILMGSGHYFDMLSPETSVVTDEDIAWGLANTARFRGQTVEQATQTRCYYGTYRAVFRLTNSRPRSG